MSGRQGVDWEGTRMTKLKPSDWVEEWGREMAVRRLLMCAGMLHVHGFMTRTGRKDR